MNKLIALLLVLPLLTKMLRQPQQQLIRQQHIKMRLYK